MWIFCEILCAVAASVFSIQISKFQQCPRPLEGVTWRERGVFQILPIKREANKKRSVHQLPRAKREAMNKR